MSLHARTPRLARVLTCALPFALLAAPAAALPSGTALPPGPVPPAGAARTEPGTSAPNAVLAWNATAAAAATAACLAPTDNPLHESRLYAMTHLAIHDALNAIDRRYLSYGTRTLAPADASAEAAVASAARNVLVPGLSAIPAPFPASCGESGVAVVDEAYARALDAIADGPAEDAGVAVGARAAEQILDLRASDGSGTPLVDPTHPQGTAPGEYRFTPGNTFAFAPGWGDVTPFVERRWRSPRATRPYPVTSTQYAADVAEVQRLGGDGTTTATARTPEQTQTALFWLESSPLQWNRIARSAVATRGLDLWDSARLFALLDVTLADGYVGSFRTKYTHGFWRPVTAIREAATDGNPSTEADPTWTPLAGTPPIPEHDSAHAVEGAAAARVLALVLGSDAIAFTTCSLTLPDGERCDDAAPVTRTYGSFSQAARENGESRILVGFHFRHAVEDGLDTGRHLGDQSVRQVLRPVTGRHAVTAVGWE